MESEISKLRLLNFDDLYLLKFLGQSMSLTSIARELHITQPAVSQRLRKVEQAFGKSVVEKSGRDLRLTNEGQAICKKASDAISLMGDISVTKSKKVINLGTRPEAGRTWLWPAVINMRKKYPHILFHMSFGSGSEVLAQLGSGRLDVVLTSAPLTTKDFRSIELDKEEYCFVASPKIAASIKTIKDLEKHTFIEHDRSFPFLRYLDAQKKADTKFRDIWFLESTEIMASALIEGEGVGIIPAYIAKRYIPLRKLKKINVGIPMSSDHFRLVYRADRPMADEMQLLSAELIRLKLR